MNKTYKRHTLGELIEALRALPANAMVHGLDLDVDSYRGYYDRNAIAPGPSVNAHDLADTYTKQIGNLTHGYKGGEYSVKADELVYYASYGDTGPSIIGLEASDDGFYRPVLLAEDWRF